MASKTLGPIIAIAVIALVMFAIAGTMLGDASPKVRIKIAVEKALPVRVESIEVARDEKSHRSILTIAAAPRAGTLSADVASSIATRAAAVLVARETLPLEYDVLEVRLGGHAPARFERLDLERRAHFQTRLDEVAKAIAPEIGPGARPPTLLAVEEGPRQGIAFDATPPGCRDLNGLAKAVFRAAPYVTFVVFPAEKPGQPPFVVRR